MDFAHQAEDLQAVPPPADESASSSPIEEQPHSFFSRRKKTVAAVVSIVVVAAVGVGVAVAVSAKPNNPTAPEQATGASQSYQDVIDPSKDEYSVSAHDETPQAVAVPQDQELEVIAEGVIDDYRYDESQDVFYEMGYDAAHPDDIIIDAGYAQREPEEIEMDYREEGATPSEEKVPFDSEDVALAIADFEGPLSQFIVTEDMTRMSTSSNGKCQNGKVQWWMQLTTDQYPWENSWSLEDKQGMVIAKGPPDLTNYARTTKYQGRMCIGPGRYNMVFKDKSADGICCDYGNGTMNVRVNGQNVAQTNDQPFGRKQWGFIVKPSQQKPNPSPKPTLRPTRRPTPNSRQPTPKPQSLRPVGDLHSVEIIIRTDKWAVETGYQFVDLRTNEVLISRPRGKLKNEMTYKEELKVSRGRYRLDLDDGFKGIESPGYYSVKVDGEEVMYGNTFDTRADQTKSYVIRPGYTPPMTARDKMWLDGHNKRRKKFHESNGVPYNRLVWSTELAEDAKNWVPEITPTCRLSREPGLAAGENFSSRTSNGPRDEGPEAILDRWSDNKMSFGYPKNDSLTQVHWRATRYVGCYDTQVKMKSANNNREILCYVSICRYARAGNCAMQSFQGDWMKATLADRSKCGPSCIGNVCY